MSVGLEHFLVISVILFLLGLFIVTTQRNGIRILMGIELILNAANLNLIAFNRYFELSQASVTGSIFAVFVIILAAAEAAVALAIVLAIYQQFSTVHLEEISSMKH